MRKTLEITIETPGRDYGKKFKLTEMDASSAEDWAFRALFAMGKSNIEVPPEAMYAGWSIVAFVGLKALLGAPYEEAKPLLDDMMRCVESLQETGPRPLIASDIEEVSTRMFLRDEVFKLHANFSIRETLLNVQSALTPPKTNEESSS